MAIGFINNQLLVLLAIMFLGYLIGHIKVRGISLGNSACLFVAILAGLLGAELPSILISIGIIFFIYPIGLQAGPQFFRLFHKRGLKFAILALVTIVLGASVALLLSIPLKIDIAGAVGVFAGAMTSTPALASAINAIETYLPGESGHTSLGYAIAYPFGLISEMLFVQMVPKIFSKKIQADKEKEERERELRGFKSRSYRLTNINLVGKTIEALDIHNIARVNLTRFKRGESSYLCTPETKFELGDIVVAVGQPEELEKFQLLFGEDLGAEIPPPGFIEIKDIFVSSSKLEGRLVRDLRLPETYGITITRLYRGEVEITPTGRVALEIGDLIKIVGKRENVDRFTKMAGSERKRIDDTNILILTLGMFVGAAIGEIPFTIGSLSFKLGVAGGPLFVALLLGHFGRIGKWSVRIPNATKVFLRDLGLVLFLVGIGVKTGHELLSTIGTSHVLKFIVLGGCVSLVSMFGAFFLIHNVLKVPLSASLGALCGAKTSSPSLGVLIKTIEDDSPAIAYAAVYPVAIITLTLIGQLMVWFGMSFLV